MPAVII